MIYNLFMDYRLVMIFLMMFISIMAIVIIIVVVVASIASIAAAISMMHGVPSTGIFEVYQANTNN